MSRISRLREAMAARVLLLDGATGTMMQGHGLGADDFAGAEGCNEILCETRPDVVRAVHRAYLDAGADIIETNSFGGTPTVLAEFGLAGRTRELNRLAAELARAEAGETAWVAGSIGPTTRSLALTGGTTFQELADSFAEQARGLIEGGADFLLVETCQDTLNTKAALAGIAAARSEAGCDTPIAVSATLEPGGRMLAGQTIEAFWAALRHHTLLYLGLNCGTGPDLLVDAVRSLAGGAAVPIGIVPNAGLPDAEGRYTLSPDRFAEQMASLAGRGWINLAGGCCGTTPAHIAALARALANSPVRTIPNDERTVLSGLDELEVTADNRPILVGERTNVVGSRRFRRLIEEERFEEATEIGRAQVEAGAQVVDLCLASSDRNELDDCNALLPLLLRQVRVPIMLDTTDPAVVASALQQLQGRSIINSINLEDGLTRFEQVAPLAKEFGAAVVVGCIDEDPDQGMALTLDRKLAVAERSLDLLTGQFALEERDILFDPLVFPVGTGDAAYEGTAAATLDAVAAFKERWPNCGTLLGVSNISFGLPPAGREVMNAAFLFHAMQRGLDYAIVNTEAIARYGSLAADDRSLADDLLFSRHGDALGRFVERFREVEPTAAPATESELSTEELLSRAVVEGRRTGLIALLDAALESLAPLDIINGPLLRGMAEVGRLFNARELIVAEVLQSAEVMKAAVTHLEPRLDRHEASSRGTLLLATVRGDVHDIGKNLVKMLFENNGFHVVDLGIKVAAHTLTLAAQEHKPDLIGLSGLLVKSTGEMATCAEDLRAAKVDTPLLLGGAALTRRFVRERVASVYDGPVFYAPDAMRGLSLATQWADPASREEARSQAEAARPPTPHAAPGTPPSTCSLPEAPAAVPPNTERHLLDPIPLDELLPLLNPDMLYGKHLGLRGKFEKLLAQGDLKAERLQEEIDSLRSWAEQEGVLRPRAIWRFVPCGRDGDELVLFDGPKPCPIPLPRQVRPPHLCAADFVRPLVEGCPDDYLGVLLVTAGGVQTAAAALAEQGELLRSFALQALALEVAEAAAEWTHRQMRADWGLVEPSLSREQLFRGEYQGARLSFGYPACPDLEGQRVLLALLGGAEEIGVELTEGCMLSPEASVSALVFHHPDARPFSP